MSICLCHVNMIVCKQFFFTYFAVKEVTTLINLLTHCQQSITVFMTNTMVNSMHLFLHNLVSACNFSQYLVYKLIFSTAGTTQGCNYVQSCNLNVFITKFREKLDEKKSITPYQISSVYWFDNNNFYRLSEYRLKSYQYISNSLAIDMQHFYHRHFFPKSHISVSAQFCTCYQSDTDKADITNS